jgi:hypothetical protein
LNGAPANNSATAQNVANLFRQGRDGKVTAMLSAAKQGQPPEI